MLHDHVRRVAVTGPDCGGKTQGLEDLAVLGGVLADHFVVVPEAATMLIGELGVRPPFVGQRQVRWQQAIAGLTLMLENEAANRLPCGDRRSLLCDRGLADCAAKKYVGGWQEFDEAMGIRVPEAQRRYEAVIYFDPPSERVYNEVWMQRPRQQRTYREVLELHMETLDAWKGHARMLRVPSGEHWSDKREIFFAHLRTIVGV